MLYKYQYTSEVERQVTIDNNAHLYLVEEQNISEGNFLIFSDEPLAERIVYMNVPQEEFEGLKVRQSATDMAVFQLMMEGVE